MNRPTYWLIDSAFTPRANVSMRQPSSPAVQDRYAGQIRIVNLVGVMAMDGAPFDDEVVFTEGVRQQILAAIEDPDVLGILLSVNSPGGQASGSFELADTIFEARRRKPLYVHATGLCCSAAFLVASQAERFYVSSYETALASVGTYAVLRDFSEFEKKQGLKTIVIRSGEHKAAGLDGWSPSQLAGVQRVIDVMQSEFLISLNRGRPRAKLDDVFEGQVVLARHAKSLKLIDGIQSFENTMGQLRERIGLTPEKADHMVTQLLRGRHSTTTGLLKQHPDLCALAGFKGFSAQVN